MKLFLFTLLAFFLLGFNVTASLSAQNTRSPSIATVQFCSLVRQPRSYHNRVIRIKAILVENQTPRVDGGDSFLYDPRCGNNEFTVVVALSESFNGADSAYKALQKIEGQPDKRGWTRVAVMLVGEFNASAQRKYGHLDWAVSQFAIQSIEKVSSIPATTKWPKSLRK